VVASVGRAIGDRQVDQNESKAVGSRMKVAVEKQTGSRH
jgi:hypothetical protein